MKTDSATSFINLPELSLDEKRDIFFKRSGLRLSFLAEKAGITASTLSRSLRNPTMPICLHQKLVTLGFPPELLPEPKNRKPGPKPGTKQTL